MKAAVVPSPLENAGAPVPAMVVTTLLSMAMLRTTWEDVSVTKSVAPLASMVRPQGPLRLAEVPTPSMEAELPLPTREDTTEGREPETLRTTFPDHSLV